MNLERFAKAITEEFKIGPVKVKAAVSIKTLPRYHKKDRNGRRRGYGKIRRKVLALYIGNRDIEITTDGKVIGAGYFFG